MTQLLRRRLPETNRMVEYLVEIELAYINTKHPDFHEARSLHRALTGGDYSIEASPSKPKVDASVVKSASSHRTPLQQYDENESVSNGAHSSVSNGDLHSSMMTLKGDGGRKLSSREQRDCEIIERLIRSYFLIVRKNIQDSVPKAVMHFLVNHVKDELQSELVASLYRSAAHEHDQLLSESIHIAQRRREATEMLEVSQRTVASDKDPSFAV